MSANQKLRTVLLIDDDVELASFLAPYVEKYGYRLVHAATGAEGLSALDAIRPEAVLLDIDLPDASGLDLCGSIRAKGPFPIVMISSLGETTDRVTGLNVGGDCYLPKPFEPRELVAYLNTLLRRSDAAVKRAGGGSLLEAGGLCLDLGRREVTLDGSPIDISSAEFELLKVMTAEPGRVFDRDELLSRLRGIEWNAANRSIDYLISRIRQKLGEIPERSRFLKTVRGVGYVFLPQESQRKAG